MIYIGPKNPAWDVNAIELVPVREVQALKSGLINCFDTEAFYGDVLDFEVCGSYAFGCALPHSDVDICVAGTTDFAQQRIYQAIRNGAWARIKPKLDELGNRMRLRLDVGYNNYDNKAYNVVYSLTDMALHGRLPFAFMNESRRWNANTWRWEFKAKNARQHNVVGPPIERFPGNG